jgi:MFS transporter, DHA1 family, inner membrane transport protein
MKLTVTGYAEIAAGRTQRHTDTNWSIVLLVTGAGVVSAFQFGKPSIALPALQASLGIGIAPVSWLLSAFALVGALLGLWIGLRVDAWGARRMLLTGLMTQAAASALGGLASSLPWLLASRVVEGVGFLAVVVAGPALVHRAVPPPRRDRAFALWGTFMPVGMGALMIVAPRLEPIGWQGLWLANAVLLATYAVLFAIFARESEMLACGPLQADPRRPRPPAHVPAQMPGLRRVLSRPAPWLVALLFVTFSAMFFSVFTFLPTILSGRLAITQEAIGPLSAIAVVMSAVGTLVCGALLGRGLAPLPLLVAGFVVMGIASPAVLLPSVPAALSYAAALLMSLASGLVPVILFAAAARHAPSPSQVGATMGMAMQGNNLGLLIGPAAAGAIVQRWAWPSVAAGVCLLGVIALILIHALRRVRPAATT